VRVASCRGTAASDPFGLYDQQNASLPPFIDPRRAKCPEPAVHVFALERGGDSQKMRRGWYAGNLPRMSVERPPRFCSAFTCTALLEAAFALTAILLGAVQAWAFRSQPSTIDLVSYLDIADAYRQGQWHVIVNAYWNPLYSWVLAVFGLIVRPSPQMEYQTAKLADFCIFLVTVLCFRWFLKTLRVSYCRAIQAERARQAVVPDWAWIVAGYTIFIWSSLDWITLSSNTPDMLASALAFCAWAMLFQLEQRGGLARYAALGLTLALGYYARTAMFLVAVVMLALEALREKQSRNLRGVAMAALVFAAATSPFVAAISLARGHLTIGDNAKLNHIWLADPPPNVVPNRHWQGGPPGNGTPRHPSRVLWSDPPAFEFATPIGGTYPPWTDPSYWYEGLAFHVDWAAEWTSFRDNIRFDADLFGTWLVIVLAAAAGGAGHLRWTWDAVRSNARYWIPAAAGLVLYLVGNDLLYQRTATPQPPSRYVAVFAVLFSLTTAASLRFRKINAPRAIEWGAAAVVLLVCGGLMMDLVHTQRMQFERSESRSYWLLTQDLQRAGIGTGMRVATIGSPDKHEFWARLARAQIIAEVPSERLFWASSPEVRKKIEGALAGTGAQAIVSWAPPTSELPPGWQRAAQPDYAVRPLTDAIAPVNR
jgi:hypothetical protein